MIATLRTERTQTLDQMRAFVEGNEPVDFGLTDRTSASASTAGRWSVSGITA